MGHLGGRRSRGAVPGEGAARDRDPGAPLDLRREHGVAACVCTAWGPAGKVAQAEAIASWLAGTTRPAIVGIDANTPKIDAPALAESVWWNAGEERLLGVERIHRLRDVYREVAERDPALAAAVLTDRPLGPLGVSYRRGHGERAVDCRYDSILASQEFVVRGAGYEYETP